MSTSKLVSHADWDEETEELSSKVMVRFKPLGKENRGSNEVKTNQKEATHTKKRKRKKRMEVALQRTCGALKLQVHRARTFPHEEADCGWTVMVRMLLPDNAATHRELLHSYSHVSIFQYTY